MHQQKKVVILCEYFPPSTNTAANRPFGWFTYLPENGYYPIIFCRNYVNKQPYHLTKTEKGEIHAIYWEDDFFKRKIASTKNKGIRNLFIAMHLFVENAWWYAPSRKMKNYLETYLQNNKVQVFIATGSPFSLFHLASTLSKKFLVPWIADYRDDWTSNEVFIKPPIAKQIQKADTFRESKYVASAIFFTTVTEYYVQKISTLINKKGYCIENGFMETIEGVSIPTSTLKHNMQEDGKLHLLYTGILYKSQDITILLKALNKCIQNGVDNICMNFIGSEKIPAVMHQSAFIKLLDKHVFFRPRMPKTLLEKEMDCCDILLYFSFHGKNGILKGVPGSKLYDYILSKKPILVCEPDDDIVQKKLTQTKQGIFCSDENQLANQLTIFATKRKANEKISLVEIDAIFLQQNSRQYQTKKLAELLNNM